MARILFIGPYRQNDGWGQSAQDFVRALAKTGHDITTRPIYMAENIDRNQYELFDQLEKNKFDKYDICIQNVLPNYMDYNGNFTQNIGLALFETAQLNVGSWISRLNLMDKIIVKSKIEADNLKKDGLKADCRIVHEAVRDISQIEILNPQDVQPESIREYFKFYFIGEFIERKNLGALICAFHTEFHRNEPVALIIKTSKPGLSTEQLFAGLQNYIAKIKTTLRIYQNLEMYQQEILFLTHLSDIDMLRIHKSCDCFVMPSHGESVCRPAIEAMRVGNPVICTRNTGMEEFVNEDNGWLIDSFDSPVFTEEPPLIDIYTGHESWKEIKVNDLRKAMRSAFTLSKGDITKKKDMAKEKVKDFYYDKIAKEINEALI